jgi:protease-4
MKKHFLLIGCLAFPLIAIIAFFIGLNQPVKDMGSAKPLKDNSWLHLNPAGVIADYNEVEADFGLGFMNSSSSVEEICTKIKLAASDKNIKGIIITPSFIQLSYSGIHEIGEAIQIFKQSKKPVLAHLTLQSQKDYWLAAYADKVAMEPAASAGMLMEGVQANISFYKNLLDKLGLKVNIIRSGQFKGYGEEYSRTSLSPETYNNIKQLLEDRYTLLINDLATQRKLTAEQVKAIFEQRADYLVSADYAKQAGLVDIALGKDEFYKQNNIDKKQLTSITDYNPAQSDNKAKDKIAVCYLQGGITSGVTQYAADGITAVKVQKLIDQIKKDKKIKAVVLRVNSPGGSALESELIYRKLEQLKKDLPIVISMSGVAASGGYYISAASDYIVADPYTVTGSIGVIQLLPDASGLGKKIGISNQSINFGKYAGAMNLMNSPSEELLASLQRNSENVYSEFKHRVVQYRKIDYDSLENLAGGRVWSAQDALSNHLIDQIGTLEDAITKASKLAKITTWQTVVMPEKKPYFELFLEQLDKGRLASNPELNLETISAIISRQMQNIFKPYTVLCVMPFDFE